MGCVATTVKSKITSWKKFGSNFCKKNSLIHKAKRMHHEEDKDSAHNPPIAKRWF